MARAGRQKTHKGAKKRFKVTRSGKVKAAQSNNKHLKNGKSKKSRRRDLKGHIVSVDQAENIKALLSN